LLTRKVAQVTEVNLSKAVRSNLLSLQSTADSMARTQERLATGLKVNSALDNPTNFFTSSSLNSRASDMSNLLDAMSSGVKVIEAADNGLSAITKTVESMQSTLRQARQDKSFKTQSFAIDSGATGLLGFSGGAVGDAAVEVSLGSAGAVQSTFASSTDYTPLMTNGAHQAAFLPSAQSFDPGDAPTFQIRVDGGAYQPFSITTAIVSSVGNNNTVIDSLDEFTDAINAGLAADLPSSGLVAKNDGHDIFIFSSTVGAGSSAHVGNINYNGTSTDYGLVIAGGSVAATDTPKSIEISDGSQTASITLNSLNAFTAADARTYIQSQLDALGMEITVGGTGDRIDLAGAADGSNTVSVGGADAAAVFGASGTQLNGATAGVRTVDALVTEINASTSLSGKIRASNDAGKLRIENLSTEDLTITGVGTDGEIDGSTGEVDIGGNDVRKNLVKQFNELRDQLDKLADDASFNGINLLRGDKLKLTFNETGSSTIDIQAKDADGDATSIDTATLGIENAETGEFDSDAAIDARLTGLSNALGTLRSQSSAFGSNLSIVQNRTDFTKKMINTLETGAANLTLADTNEEAANLLALQTRQQLSSTALSMASQSDQAVLRLF
jgi:flagellin-like hook-associated protein FlgL